MLAYHQIDGFAFLLAGKKFSAFGHVRLAATAARGRSLIVKLKKLPSKQDFSATAYDSTADKILVTYDFIGHKSDYILYGIPQGIRETFGQVLNSTNKNN